MRTLKNDVMNKQSEDSFDKLIFEKNLRIKTLVIDKDLDILLILFNTGNVIKCRLSDYSKLKNADEADLNAWRLIKGGVGVRWEKLDEDLSVKGFIKNAALQNALRSLERQNDEIVF